MNQLTLQEVHAILLDMAKAFHGICVRHGIPYYMLGGTMLGAVRHKGFIPWDDDMDFGIPREHFDRFAQAAASELPAPYRMLTYRNSEYACLGIGKISDSETVFREIFSVRTEETLGVNVDVFPLDYTDGRTDLFSLNGFARLLFKFQKLLYVKTDERKGIRRIAALFLQKLIRPGRDYIPSRIDAMMKRHMAHKGYIYNTFGAWAEKELVPEEYFGEPVPYAFEDASFNGVSDPDKYLRHMYGDYMVIPEEGGRHIHASEFYRK